MWDPGQYLKFVGQRARPAFDLLARVEHAAPRRIYDLGCGPGNITRALAARWPDAHVTGVDLSKEMLDRAAADQAGGPSADQSNLDWQQADVAAWRPDAAPDIIYSNAALHWLTDHEALFPRLLASLAPDGVLAVQMPRNWDQPSHTCMVDAAAAGPWKEALAVPLEGMRRVPGPEAYYDMLSSGAAALDLWESTYAQIMDGDDPVAEWTKGTALKPFLDVLPEEHRRPFFDAYAERLRAAYPRRADGRTLFPFKRLFIVAKK